MLKNPEGHFSFVQYDTRFVDARLCSNRDAPVTNPDWRTEIALDGVERKLMENEAPVPIAVELGGYRKLEMLQVFASGAKHPGPLDIGVLLQPMLDVPREK